MTTKYAKHVSVKETPQSEPIPGSSQVQNSAGGYSFAVDDWTRMQRFLILGSEGGSYYATERKLTQENAACVTKCLSLDPARAVQVIVDISDAGRAPKNDPAIFALAIAAANGSPRSRELAMAAIPKVCRIGTHIFQFVAAVNELRGWGSGLRKGVAAWYETMPIDELSYQVAKYHSVMDGRMPTFYDWLTLPDLRGPRFTVGRSIRTIRLIGRSKGRKKVKSVSTGLLEPFQCFLWPSMRPRLAPRIV